MRAEVIQSEQQASLTPGSSLLTLYGIAKEAGAEPVAREALALAERVSESRFYVAVLGQFKRGKSTLINALLGDAILPTGVVPVVSKMWLDRWRAEEEPVAEALYAEAAQRFVALANDFLERLATSQETETAADLPTSVGPEVGFRVKSRLFYKDLW